MIKFAKKEDKEQIKKLWREAFGDTNEDIELFLDYYLEDVLVFVENRIVKGMLSMIPVNCKDKKGRYVYAVATGKQWRNLGISTKLLEYAKEHIKKEKESFLVLKPANKGLFEFYKKRGYTELRPVIRKEYSKIVFPKPETNIKKILPYEYYNLRKEFLEECEYIEWGERELEYIYKVYDGNFYHITSKNGSCVAICSYYNGLLDIKELFIDNMNISDCVSSLNGIFKASQVRITMKGEGDASLFMIYPKKYKNLYFNIAID